MKDLTVFILTHNRGEMLLETIDSVLNQTCHDFKFVVSDNSSNDETQKLLKERNLLDKIEYRKREKEYPSLEHFNMCLAEVDTKYFVLFHDDDIMMPEYVETMYNAINGSKYVAVGCNAFFLEGEKRTDKTFFSMKKVLLKNNYDLLKQYYKGLIAPYPSYIYNKHFLLTERFNNSCGKYSDVSWLAKILNKGNIIWLQEPLMYYRKHQNQDSNSYSYNEQLKLINYFKNQSSSNQYIRLLNMYRIEQLYFIEKLKSRKISNLKLYFKYSKLRFLKIIIKKILRLSF